MGKLRVSLRLGKRGWSFDRKFSIFYQWPFWLTFFSHKGQTKYCELRVAIALFYFGFMVPKWEYNEESLYRTLVLHT